MSSSSGPERPEGPLEEVEELEQTPAERAQAERGRARGGGWLTLAWATPGTLWLLFFLIGPVVMIVLVSFWTPSLTGFEK